MNPAKGNFTDEIGASDLSSVFDSFSVFNVDVMNIYIYIYIGFFLCKVQNTISMGNGGNFCRGRVERSGDADAQSRTP